MRSRPRTGTEPAGGNSSSSVSGEAAAVLSLREARASCEYEPASPAATEILIGLSPAQAAQLTRQVPDSLVAYASPAA